MKKTLSLLVFIVLVGVVVFAGSPYYTAYQLKTAYENRDGNTLVTHIDFTQLQPNIQTQLNTQFSDTLSNYPMVEQLGGAALTQAADEFIAQAVTRAITAENISNLIQTQGQANQATKELAAAWAIASDKINLQRLIQDMIAQRGDIDAVIKNQVDIMMTEQSEELATQAQLGNDSTKPQLAYCGMNCFTISGNVKGYPVVIEMQREGLIEWKIVDVVLP